MPTEAPETLGLSSLEIKLARYGGIILATASVAVLGYAIYEGIKRGSLPVQSTNP